MVIEYIGTIIRNEVANRKEKMYESQVCTFLFPCFVSYLKGFLPIFLKCVFVFCFVFQNRGVYMFRIDSEHVIDATITGGPARYERFLEF